MNRVNPMNPVSQTSPANQLASRSERPADLLAGLKHLGLTSLAKAVPQVLDAARVQQWPYDTFLQQALDAEMAGRAQRAYERRIRAAHLPTPKSLDSFDFAFQPALSERLVRELATLHFVETATNVVLLGPPGVGKTHLALGLLGQALEAGYSGRFTTLRQLADELETTTWRQQRRRYLTPRVLAIDEVGYLRLSPGQTQALFDLVTARYERGAILLTSNRSFAEWGALLGDEVLATALLDRLLHHAEVVAINGRSYRMKDRQLPEPTALPAPDTATAMVAS